MVDLDFFTSLTPSCRIHYIPRTESSIRQNGCRSKGGRTEARAGEQGPNQHSATNIGSCRGAPAGGMLALLQHEVMTMISPIALFMCTEAPPGSALSIVKSLRRSSPSIIGHPASPNRGARRAMGPRGAWRGLHAAAAGPRASTPV